MTETRNCQNCKKDFTVESEDFAFYKKISVPPPTFCPNCRFQRQLAFFNLVSLYKRNCDLCGKSSLSAYPPDTPYKVYCPPCWWSDKWDPFEYGRDYDFSRPFFEQFNELLHDVPHIALFVESNVFQTSPYTNYAGSLKNCYLLFNAEYNENSSVGHYVFNSNWIFDSSLAMQCENSYDSMHFYKVNGGVGLRTQVSESLDCYFVRDCQNCQNCFASANLRNKKYYIFNKPYTKEEYFEEIKKWDLGSYKTYRKVKKMAEEHWDSLPQKSPNAEMNVNCSGNLYFQSKNCKDSFEVTACEDSRYLRMAMDCKDCYDVTGWADAERCIDSFCIGRGAFDVKFSFLAALPANNMEYSALVIEGNNFFGCASIKKGEYCIFNKRYSKEEFESLRKKIIDHMNEKPYTDKVGRVYKYGEFFPAEMSPWAYNQTLADRFYPISEEEAKKQGFNWSLKKETLHDITKKAEELPDHIKDAEDSILKEVIGCLSCGKGFKITATELSFLRQKNLPLPRHCPFCRIQEKLDIWVSEFKLVRRKCDRCDKMMDTSKSIADKKVYCRECYLKEVI
jgi:Zn ribbon nucleic-acid-binding protein